MIEKKGNDYGGEDPFDHADKDIAGKVHEKVHTGKTDERRADQ